MIGVWGVSWILNYCDRYIIALSSNSYNVGIYDMAYKIAENSINMIISAFTLAIFPILITVWKKQGKEAVEIKTKEVLKYFFILVLPATFGLIIISNKLFGTIIDSSYAQGSKVIILVSLGMLFNGLNSILNKIWQLDEKTKNIFYIMLISVVINIILNIIFIPKFGIVAAAYTTLISYIISVIITYIKVSKNFKIMIDIFSLLKSIFCTVVMGITLLLINNHVNSFIGLLSEIILAILIYGIISVLTKNIDIKTIIRRRK